jgi:hypothetical protein
VPRIERFVTEMGARFPRMRACVTRMGAHITRMAMRATERGAAISADWRDVAAGRRRNPRDGRDHSHHGPIHQRNRHVHIA